ncbi:MAG: outer membrane protein OmpA, partial [Deltaproteobacteria bacterium]|nr:outer membrane protein OmpA [Deltaproteobacteria bacterium]
MPRHVCWIALGALAITHTASADSIGFQLNRFEPAPAGDGYFGVEAPWYRSSRLFAGGLTFDYAHNLLVASNGSPIESAIAGHLDLAAALSDRLAFSFSLPLVLSESGTSMFGVGPTGAVAGDPRIGARVRLYRLGDKLSLSGSLFVWVPIGGEGKHTGDAHVRVMPKISAGGALSSRIRWAATGGYLYREVARLSDTVSPVGSTVGPEFQIAAGAHYLAHPKFSIGPEANLSVAVGTLPAAQSRVGVEMLLGAHLLATDQVTVGFAVGAGAAGAPQAPDFRALVSVTYTPRRQRVGHGTFERVIVMPDEEGHVGAVEVNDGKTVTLLDKAYASSEVSRDGKTKQVQSSPQAIEQRLGPLARALPPSDRDGDEIVDAGDACPERAGPVSTDPLRNGCPQSTEKVVVLPDADGHVGGVEVDDGKGMTVLDKAYASSEVAVDGTAHAVPPSSARAVDRSVAQLANQLPVADRDADGIVDANDACPDRVGIASTDAMRNGCPESTEKVVVLPDADGHIGGLEVNDGKTVTVLDKAYASSEVATDGTAHAVPPSAPSAVDRSVAQLATQLPVGDRDGDGTADGDDACPERAGTSSPDPLRNGCPKSTEKVVVLPDADGHVGGIEVNDGKTVTVLDKPYSTSEVGTDGKAREVPGSLGAV